MVVFNFIESRFEYHRLLPVGDTDRNIANGMNTWNTPIPPGDRSAVAARPYFICFFCNLNSVGERLTFFLKNLEK